MRGKRLLLLMPVLASLSFVAIAGQGQPASSIARKSGILVALTNPLGLFAERSPGERGAGALLSTKPEREAALAGPPYERMLSGIREREVPFGLLPVVDNAVFVAGPATGGAFPAEAPFAGGQIISWPSLPSLPGPYDVFQNSGSGAGGGFAPLSQIPAAPLSPGTAPLPNFAPGVPEPGTWAMMILGFFAAGMALRRRTRRQAYPACVR